MTAERIEALPYSIPFRRPFVTSRITHHTREGLIVLLRTANGVGAGEASPPPSLGRAAVAEALRLLASGTTALPPWVRFGIDTARLDLEARARGIPLARVLDDRARDSVRVNRTISSADPDEAAAEGAAAAESGYTAVKVKVGVGTVDDDVRRVAALRAAVGPAVAIRIDANQAWSEDEAVAALARLAAFDPEYAEQPVAADDLACLARVRSRGGVRIAADEAVTGPDAARRIVAARAADVLIVKPARVGGFAPTREIAAIAAAGGLSVVITSTLDTSIGVAAAVHIAASLPVEPLACGLATLGLLGADVVVPSSLRVTGGALAVPGPGLGCTVDLRLLAQLGPR